MNSTRGKIEKTVEQNPGISFTELKEKTGRSNGVLQYHIRKSERIEKVKCGLVPKNYCNSCQFKDLCGQSCNLKELGKDKTAEILNYLFQGWKQKDIAVRSAMHCVHSWFNDRGKPTVRASLHLYNDENDIQKFSAALEKIALVNG